MFENETPRVANRLIRETSPYLRQHAYNPVDWYPWGDEAFAAARERNVPVFLSVGYSACHWCHVMEHESFEDAEIAAYMNANFVNIKVDREERPDVDQIYMTAVQIMTQRGGWPMSVFLTHDGRPFFGGTYWPPRNARGMMGFQFVLERVVEAWTDRRDEVERGADELTNDLRTVSIPEPGTDQLKESLVVNAARKMVSVTDKRYGGYGGAPKFPHAMDLRVLLRAHKRTGDGDFLDTARLTLDRMANGGLYDHLGGGFHRYSTDERWLAPHFEKMLYDNALLVPAYLEAWQITGDAEYRRIVVETLDYVLREMTSPEGGFHSTQDADSEGHEGKFFVWYDAEIDKLLGDEDSAVFKKCYDVSPPGNWEGHNILNRPRPVEECARVLGRSLEDVQAILARSRKTLYEHRETRVHPGRDDKVLVNWNGMMIAAMSQAAFALGDQSYAAAARAAADFILDRMRQPDGRLWHSHKDGESRFNGYLDDYACLIEGLVELYQAVADARYLDAALALATVMIAEFRDPDGDGFFYTGERHESLITRTKETHDGSVPAGNTMAATALVKLGHLCGRPDLSEVATRTLGYLSTVLSKSPLAAAQGLLALDFHLGPTHEIVLVDGDDPAENLAVQRALGSRFIPNRVIARRPAGVTDEGLPPAVRALMKGRAARSGAATLYVCRDGACGLPVTGVAGVETVFRG